MIGTLLALSLAVVTPAHWTHRFVPSFGTHTWHAVSHRTLLDRGDAYLEARIDRATRQPRPDRIAVVTRTLFVAPPDPSTQADPSQARRLRRLRMAPPHSGDADPFS